MFRNCLLLVLTGAVLLASCATTKKMKYTVTPAGEVKAETITENFLAQLLMEDEKLKPFLDQKDSLKIQVIYTRIDRDKDNKPRFTDFYFNVNPANYFYPASTVKLPTALLALEKLKRLNTAGVNRNTTMVTGKATALQSAVYNDPTTRDGRPTIGNYARKVFLVSDNDAQNRMYEFLGQKYLNDALRSKGFAEAEIIHRLDIFLPEDENRKTNPVTFLDQKGAKLFEQPMQFNEAPYYARHDAVGRGYMSNGKLVAHPMDFSHKNRISLPALHQVLKAVIFPASMKPEERFDITEDDLQWVRKSMSTYPTESDLPFYSRPGYYPAYCKFLLYGSDPKAELLPGVRIFNKVGDAYGFLLDIAYVADFDHQVEFMLSAVIYCNKDGILNDDAYDYDNVGFPFMKALGQRIYSYELGRQRDHKPDLSELRFEW